MSTETPDVRYADLIAEAIARIPALAPEWTDHNPSDPGIALLELTAWLVETVLYRTTRVTDDGRQALLGLLLGQDPEPSVGGAALDEAIRDAIKALRAPYRVITPSDWRERLRADWPASAAAQALGVAAGVAGVSVFANLDLEGADPYARDDSHVSVVVTPAGLDWRWQGALDPAWPMLFWRQYLAGALAIAFPQGADARLAGPGSVLVDAAFAAGETLGATLDAAALGATGELRLELDAAALANGLTLVTDGVADRRLTAPDAPLLGARWVDIARAGWLQVVVTTETTTALRLELRYYNNQVAATAEGDGVVCLSREIAASSVGDPLRGWQLRLFSPDATAPIAVDWRVVFTQTPRRWAEGGDALLDAIWDFYDPRRLLTVRHHVTAPRWVHLAVQATVYLADGTDIETARPRLYDALYAAFPLPGDGGRPLGQAVFATEVIAALEAVEGVDYVEGLTIGLDGLADRVLTDAGEAYGLALMPDEAVVPRCDLIALTLYERS